MIERLLFYDDSEVFGGHQVSAVTAAAHAASAGVDVSFAYRRENERLASRLEAYAPVKRMPLEIPRIRLQAAAAAAGIGLHPARAVIGEVSPDAVIAVQGNILLSTRAVEAARRLHVPAISFIPMALKGGGASVRNRFWNVVARRHYSRPDAFITTSATAAGDLRASGVTAPIHVAYYGPDVRSLKRYPRDEVRKVLGIGDDELALAIVGRVVFAHKGHDVLLEALVTARSALGPFRLIVAGDGPDHARLEELARAAGLSDAITWLRWTDDPSIVYSAVDLVALPSRFEGLPLVALEAMWYRLKIVGSDVDGMTEVLPPEWRVPAGDARALAEVIVRVSRCDATPLLDEHERRIRREMNSLTFGEAFLRAVVAVTSRRS